MGKLQKTINNSKNHTLAVYLWECFDEVHGHIRPYPRRHGQGLKEPGGVEGFCIVPLADGACFDEVYHQPSVMLDVKVMAQALEGLLHPFMARRVCQAEDVGEVC